MTQFFSFDDLTWPEVAALPRNLPIVLPLGKPEGGTALAGALGHPARAAVLPAIPYGWAGNLLPVDNDVLARMVRNLAACLLEDGFTNFWLALPANVSLDLDLPLITGQADQNVKVPAWDPEKVVLLPVGHVEQHGHHLPFINGYHHY